MMEQCRSGDGEPRVTLRKPHNQDAITQAQAAEILGISVGSITRLIREKRLHRVFEQFPTMSREEVEAFRDIPVERYWIGVVEAANVMELSTSRVSQLADAGRLPFEVGENGRRRFRRSQVITIWNARATKWHGKPIGTE